MFTLGDMMNQGQKRRMQGLCWKCTTPAVEGRSLCQRHLVRIKELSAAKRQQRSQENVCITCGAETDGTTLCVQHKELAAANMRRYRKAQPEKQRLIDAQRAEWLRSQKYGKSCRLCGESRTPCLDFHHRDPSSKEFNVALAKGRSKTRILAEIAKCDVLCSNCHRCLHDDERKLHGS